MRNLVSFLNDLLLTRFDREVPGASAAYCSAPAAMPARRRRYRTVRGECAAFCLVLLAFCATLWAQQSERGKAEPWGQLRVEITDRDTGRAIAAHCYLVDPTKQSWSPVGAINYVKPPERHFIASGGFQIALPPRKYTLTVERGPEYRPVTREVQIGSGESREEKIELSRWINMNARGWYSGDLHNHRALEEMPKLLLAEDLNLAPTLTQWVWEDRLISKAPPASTSPPAFRSVDATHAYSVFDTEIERLVDGPGAVDLLGLRTPVEFRGYLVSPPNSVFTEAAHRQGGYVDAEKITWRDVAALVALGYVDFAGIVHNHFNRHGVDTETDPWGMIPKEKPEYQTPVGMALWTMDVYYKFLNCGYKLPVSAGSASGVKPSPLGFDRVYAHLPGRFSYQDWFRALKAGRSFATNGPMLFLTVNGHEPGDTILVAARPTAADLREFSRLGRDRPPAGTLQASAAGAGKAASRLQVHVEASTGGELGRVDVVWKGRVVKTVAPTSDLSRASVDFEFEADESGWLAARAFERPGGVVRFAQTSPVYLQVGSDRGVVSEDAKYFLAWIDRAMKFYEGFAGFRNDADRQAMLGFFRKARAVYERLAVSSARRGQAVQGRNE